MNRRVFPLALALLVLAGCRKAPPASVAATVNNRVIRYDQIERIYQTQLANSGERVSDDLATLQRLEVLRSLIEREMLVQRAERLSLLASDPEVDQKYNEFRAPYTQDELQRKLAERKMTVQDVKSDLRQELSIQKLINKEITSKISITDQEISDYYAANKASFNRPEPALHLAQILVTASPDPGVRNLKQDKAQNDEQARAKIASLLQRIRNGEDFSMLAENYSEDPQTAPNGGDMGFVPMSAFEQSSPEIKKLLAALPVNQVSPIIPTQGAYRLLRVLSREPAGQRELNDPRVQQEIRETLLSRKSQLMQSAYYEVVRNDAKIVNYFAQKVLEGKR